jgi:hypothetical protein
MAYDLVKERRELDDNQLLYDKIKWPLYKELCFRRRNVLQLPIFNKNVPRLVGLRTAPPLPTLA